MEQDREERGGISWSRERGKQLRKEGERRDILEQRERGATETEKSRTGRREEGHPGAEGGGSVIDWGGV